MKFYGLDIVGNTKLQRLTTGERTSTTPDAGRVVYDTTLSKMYYGNGTSWLEFGTGGGGGGGGIETDFEYVQITSTTDNGGSLAFSRVGAGGSDVYTYTIANFGGTNLNPLKIRGLFIEYQVFKDGTSEGYVRVTYPDGTSQYLGRQAATGGTDFKQTMFIPINDAQSSIDITLYNENSGVDVYFTIKGAWQQVSSSVPAYEGYILLQDQKSTGTNGGASVAGSWQTRDLNTEVIDSGEFCSLVANQFTLDAGIYEIDITSPFINTDETRLRLQNITDAVTVAYGPNLTLNSLVDDGANAFLKYRFEIDDPKAFEVQYYVTNSDSTGLGFAINLSGVPEIYTDVSIRKVASQTFITGAETGAKAWVNFSWSGAAIVIHDSFNVGSVVRNAKGDYTINWSTPFANTSYVIVATAQDIGSAGANATFGTKTVSSCNVESRSQIVGLNFYHANVDIPLNVVALGDQ